MKSFLKNYRQSPRKTRLIADLIRGKRVDRVREILRFTNKRAAKQILKLLESAISNAKQQEEVNESNLYIKKITVDEGVKLKRRIPRAMGRATPILKRASHINIELMKKEK